MITSAQHQVAICESKAQKSRNHQSSLRRYSISVLAVVNGVDPMPVDVNRLVGSFAALYGEFVDTLIILEIERPSRHRSVSNSLLILYMGRK
jgi:hypothetical protein